MHLAYKVQAAQKSLRGYIGAITSGQEDERLRLARELHDDTIQALIALKQRVQLARMKLKDASTEQPLADIEGMTEEAIQNVRRQVRALRPIYLEDLGLAAALEMLARETSQAQNQEVGFRLEGGEKRLEPAVELTLYRVAQEALNNMARHARASRAGVKLSFSAETVTLEVEDNGQGFEIPASPAEFAPSGHYGLLGMYERVELIGGTIEMRSAPGRGTSLKVRLPVKSTG
jgi:signal transduction histidine kinase